MKRRSDEMRQIFKRWYVRWQSSAHVHWSGICWFIAMLTLGWLLTLQNGELSIWLVPPYAATCSIILLLPSQPVAQPLPIVGGSTLAAGLGTLLSLGVHGPEWAVVAAGLAFVVLNVLRLYHPPSIALAMYPLLLRPGLLFPLVSVLPFTLVVVLSATLLGARLSSWPRYPR